MHDRLDVKQLTTLFVVWEAFYHIWEAACKKNTKSFKTILFCNFRLIF